METAKSLSSITRDRVLVKCIICGNIFKALLVRCLLVLHGLVCLWQAVERIQNYFLWLLSLVVLLMIVETIYRIGKRRGVENKWFLPAFLIGMFLAVPPLWILVLKRAEEIAAGATSYSLTDSLSVNSDLLLFLLEQGLLIILIFGRWVVPKPERNRGNMTKLLLSFIGIAGDMIIFFDLFTEPDIVRDVPLRYALLAVWSLSLVQFALYFMDQDHRLMGAGNLNAVLNPNRKTAMDMQRNVGKAKVHPLENVSKLNQDTTNDTEDPEAEIVADAAERRPVCGPDTWSTLLTIFTQELPYMIVRIYITITKNILSFSVIFFLAKNALVILLFLFNILGKVFFACRRRRRRPEKKSDSEGEKEGKDTTSVDGENTQE